MAAPILDYQPSPQDKLMIALIFIITALCAVIMFIVIVIFSINILLLLLKHSSERG